ncbi:MAG TPA: anthranilate phosphoribosyltransferase [Planctomycetota bacterium]|nr:anthranilate phosphoribosyltransferase [Planctomycetota bacterium]
MTPFTIAPHLETLLAKRDLAPEAASEIMTAIMEGRVPPASIAAFVVALRAKGETAAELAALSKVMRAAAVPVSAPAGTLDTCGTGGDKSETFNISTATAFVVAGMGIPVAKHGGRSVSSTSGSADVLKELGVNIEAKSDCVAECIKKAGIGFMFAPMHHPGMKHVAPVRKELGIRTVFNLLGPLSNPAGAKLQLLGVFHPDLCRAFTEVLQILGSESAMVVCGAGPGNRGHLDEFSTFGPSTFAWLKGGKIEIGTLDATTLGLQPPKPNALAAKDCAESAAIIRSVLAGAPGPARDIVCLNAAAAALVANKADAWPAALRMAERSIDAGKALEALKQLVALTV